MMNLAVSLPWWDSLDSVRRAHDDLEAASIVCFALLVAFDSAAHVLDKKSPDRARVVAGIGLIFFWLAVAAEIAGYEYGQRNDELSGKMIQSLDELAQHAEGTARRAKTTADEAKTVAESASTVAGKANKTAGEAQFKAASALTGAEDAQKKLAEVESELNRIKSPRSLSNAKDLAIALREFAGTKYAFRGVFNDDESVEFLKTLNFALEDARWIRVNLPDDEPAATTATHISLLQDSHDFDVPLAISTGVLVEAYSPLSPETINAMPLRLRPKIIRAAGALQTLLGPQIMPTGKANAGDSVRVLPGTSDVIRITVGKKP